MQHAPSDDPCPTADAASADTIENTSGEGVEAEGSLLAGAPKQKSTGGKRDRHYVCLEGVNFRFIEMFEADPEARASIREDFRKYKPTRTKLIMAALQRPGWRLAEDGRLVRLTTAEDNILSRDRAERAAAFQVQLAAQQQKHAAQLQAAESLSQQLQLELTHERAEKQQQAAEQQQQRTAAAEAATRAVEQISAAERQAVAAAAAVAAQKAQASRKERDLLAEVENLKVALDTRPTRTQVAHEADAARKCSEAAAAERIQQLEQLTQTMTTACRAACSQVAELESAVRSEQTKRGLAVTELQATKARLASVDAHEERDASLRLREWRQAERGRELSIAREEVGRLQLRVQELEAGAPLGKRGQAAPVVLQRVRTTNDTDAPFCGRSLEFMRRLVDECNGSFEGASTANALVLGLHLGSHVPDARLIPPESFRRAFLRAGIADEEAAAKRNQEDEGPWCIAQVCACRRDRYTLSDRFLGAPIRCLLLTYLGCWWRHAHGRHGPVG